MVVCRVSLFVSYLNYVVHKTRTLTTEILCLSYYEQAKTCLHNIVELAATSTSHYTSIVGKTHASLLPVGVAHNRSNSWNTE